MKTYKHKKTGIIGTLKEDGHLHFERGEECVAHETIWGGFIKDSSDWEEIIPKEWEILSFIDRGRIVSVVDSAVFSGELLLEFLSNHPIHSVKRLSDNTVLTLGDTLTDQTVKGFVIRADGKQCWLQSDLKNPDYGCCLSVAKKVEQLHTTKDGYKISTGDTYYIVDNFKVREVLGGQFTKSKWDGFRFKNKENAEDWIIRHKPCLSYYDVTNYINVYNSDFKGLSELIKTRI